ncbi:hypothetical protein LOTGIDRAFT_114310 [Lottia gigantea]|uniref:BTB domain-containing protein n=1 Tax=Lottia gigantea TaxID=225164 RepID=V4ATV6_LOTGI|nr:hypothetical protein LOTGIDRAFT_114310 [Lottia gigantea]ESO98335.1 hypothetical protein LOTGIDRAFT_114310 [Lottia gigantea]
MSLSLRRIRFQASDNESSPGSGDESPSSSVVRTCQEKTKRDIGGPCDTNCHIDNTNPKNPTLTSKNHCCKLLQGLRSLRMTDTLCDYSVIAEGQTIKVHRAVMAACSDYFRVMLTSDMKESREACVELKGVTASGLSFVVDFAYTGKLELTLENVEDVLSAATHLQVADAVELCSRFIEIAITFENCVDVLNLAELYNLSATCMKARQYMLENFEIVAASEQYFKLTPIQLASMLAENKLCVESEFKLFQLVLSWIKHDLNSRRENIALLMKNIRIPLLSGEELVEKVSREELMKTSQECVDLITEAKDYHIVVCKQPLLQNTRTQVRSERRSLIMCHGHSVETYTFKTKKLGYLKESPVPLYNPAVVVVDNFMYVCGGKYDNNENNEIATARCFRYDPRFDSWYETAPMNESRKDFVMVAMDGYLYSIAGQDENMVMCTVERYNIVTNDWDMRASINHSVYGHAGAVCNGLIFISGGQRFSGCCKDVLCYTPSTDSWEVKAPLLNARCTHVMACVQDHLYVFGGNIEDNYGFPVPIIAIEIYHPETDQWTLCARTLNIREAGACVMDDRIYIVGGINGEHYYSDLLEEYDYRTDTLSAEEKFPTRIFGRACCILTLPQYVC